MIRAIDEYTITDAVIDQMAGTKNERLKEIMEAPSRMHPLKSGSRTKTDFTMERLGSRLARLFCKWEPWGRAVVRIVLAFTFTLHGYRHVFGLLGKSAGRAAVIPLAIDKFARICWLVGNRRRITSAARFVHAFSRGSHLCRTARRVSAGVGAPGDSGPFATAATRP